MDYTGKAIWIDLDNSPHVPLFAPIIRHYRELGVEVILTARDHSQTLELLELEGFRDNYATIGRHYGKNKLKNIAFERGYTQTLVKSYWILTKHFVRNSKKHILHGLRAAINTPIQGGETDIVIASMVRPSTTRD